VGHSGAFDVALVERCLRCRRSRSFPMGLPGDDRSQHCAEAAVWLDGGGEQLRSAMVLWNEGECFAFDKTIGQNNLQNILACSDRMVHAEFRLGSPFSAIKSSEPARSAPGVGDGGCAAPRRCRGAVGMPRWGLGAFRRDR
jgi:hypothetical protein